MELQVGYISQAYVTWIINKDYNTISLWFESGVHPIELGQSGKWEFKGEIKSHLMFILLPLIKEMKI